MRGAKSYFGRIQGGETGKSPQRALTVEPTLESAKRATAQRVARLLAIGGVAPARRDRCGYTPSDRALPMAKIRSNATYHSFETTSR